MNKNIQKLQEILFRKNLEAFLITHPPNIQYLSGFEGSFAWIVITKETVYFITDGRYIEHAQKEIQGMDILCFDASFVKDFGRRQTGLWGCEDTMTIAQKKSLRKTFPNTQFRPQKGCIEDLRRTKTEDEIAQIKTAQDHVDAVLVPFLQSTLQTGITEKKLAFDLEIALRSQGRYTMSFDPIVAFGAHSSIPHHTPTEKKLQPGMNILIDCGVRHNQYCSDMTRNFGWKSVSDTYKKKYDMLRTIQEKSLALYTPNKKIADIEKTTRKWLKEFNKFFTHSLGHGIGLEAHEKPTISQKLSEKYVLKHNDVVTCEPGIYIPESFGIRIEDLVVVSGDTPKILSKTPKEIIIFE